MQVGLAEIISGVLTRLSPITTVKDFHDISGKIETLRKDISDNAYAYTSMVIADEGSDLYFPSDKQRGEKYENSLNKMLMAILYTDDYDQGLFCKKTLPSWQHIQTAYILHILHNLDITVSSWGEQNSLRSIERIVDALVSGAREDGNWGEDIYDTCFVVSALLLHRVTYASLAQFEDAVKKALRSIVAEIGNDFGDQREKEWYGAGFYGAALYVMCRHFYDITSSNYGLSGNEIKGLLSGLLQKSQGYYCEEGSLGYFRSDPTSQPTTPDAWHTAEMIIGLKYYDSIWKLDPDLRQVLGRCVKWLEGQAHDGLWCHDMTTRTSFIVTGRVLHALALVGGTPSDEAMSRFVLIMEKHFDLQPDGTGLVCDLPVTINLLLGISARPSVRRRAEHNQMQSAILAAKIGEIHKRIGELRNEVDEYAKRYRKTLAWFIFLVVVSIIVLYGPFIVNLVIPFMNR